MTAANESSTSPPICGSDGASRSATRPSSARSASTQSCGRSSGPTGPTSTRTCSTVEARRTYRLRARARRAAWRPIERTYSRTRHPGPLPSGHAVRVGNGVVVMRRSANLRAAHGLAGPIAREREVYGGKPASPDTSGPTCAGLARTGTRCLGRRKTCSSGGARLLIVRSTGLWYARELGEVAGIRGGENCLGTPIIWL